MPWFVVQHCLFTSHYLSCNKILGEKRNIALRNRWKLLSKCTIRLCKYFSSQNFFEVKEIWEQLLTWHLHGKIKFCFFLWYDEAKNPFLKQIALTKKNPYYLSHFLQDYFMQRRYIPTKRDTGNFSTIYSLELGWQHSISFHKS